jgi:tRNA 2-selenouridine synthase
MKYPLLLTLEQVLPQLAEFDTIIDARSPAEFALDHLPGAINCPVLDDEQRIRVGTLYKQVNSFEAKKVGAALVARNIAQHLEQQFLDKPRQWRPLVYCWRGGNRSGSLAHVLAKIGWPAVQLEGGYQAWRRHVFASLAELPHRFSFRVLCGPTGSGKSRLLQVLAQQGAQVLDLEQLAEHRGSILGQLPDQAQPAQKLFESRLWFALSQLDPDRPVFVEAESKKIGNLRVPEALMENMRAAGCIDLQLGMAQRIALLQEEYRHFACQPALLAQRLDCLLQLHGQVKIAHWHDLIGQNQLPELIRQLLAEHYDPSYLRSIRRNFPQFGQARTLVLADAGAISLQAAAQQLLTQD